MDEIKNIVKSIIETAQECKNGGNYDTAFSLADSAKNLRKKYIEVKENSAKVKHLKIELYYDLGGMNYFTGMV